MRRFLRRATEREPLAVTMTGVRKGERLLQVGIGDARLAATLAVKPGMSGHSAIVVSDERAAERARAMAADSGALVDVQVAPLDRLPYDSQTFDVVVVHGAAARLAPLDAAARAGAVRECHRVLRGGGRLIAMDAGTPTGLTALVRRPSAADPAYDAAGGTGAALEQGGFKPVRLLADREGYRFFEGLKAGPAGSR